MKLNKTIQLFCLALALVCSSCNVEQLYDVTPNQDSSLETDVDFGVSLNNLYSNDPSTKAGGDGDIPEGYTLVARMQLYLVNGGVDHLLSEIVEYVDGNEVVDDNQLADLDLFNNIRLSLCEEYKVFTQFYFMPTAGSESDYYLYSSDDKTYKRNYESMTSGVDAEDFYVGDTKNFSVNAAGEVSNMDATDTTNVLDITAKRKVSKVSLYVASVGSISTFVECSDFHLIYNEFTQPVYNYYEDVVTLEEASVDSLKLQIKNSMDGLNAVLTDYTFVPADDKLKLKMSVSYLDHNVEYFFNSDGATVNAPLSETNVNYSVVDSYSESQITGFSLVTIQEEI